MSLNEEFLEILRVLVSQPSSAEPSLPDSCLEDHVSPDAATKRMEENKGRRVRP
jgi:hypothetical protein